MIDINPIRFHVSGFYQTIFLGIIFLLTLLQYESPWYKIK